MKRIGLLLGLFAVTIFVLPTWTAQDVKKDAVKKDQDKADPEKKPDDKKPAKKPAPEKLVFSKKFATKVTSIGSSSREITVETYEPDPQKVQAFQTWVVQQQQTLAQQQFSALKQTNFSARANALASYQKAVYQFEIQAAQKGGINLMSVKPLELRAAENAKVRSMSLPIEFDDLGFQKKWTKKELDERRDNTGLPGFPVDFDAIKSGQLVEVYLAKQAPMAKGKKKGPDDDDPPMAKGQEFVLIIIRQEAAAK